MEWSDTVSVFAHIQRLIGEEDRLLRSRELSSEDHHHLAALQGELDGCWDLLRQRRKSGDADVTN